MDQDNINKAPHRAANPPHPLPVDPEAPIPFDLDEPAAPPSPAKPAAVSHAPLTMGPVPAAKPAPPGTAPPARPAPPAAAPGPVAAKPAPPKIVVNQPVARPVPRIAPSADRITGVKTFFTKLHPGALDFQDEQIIDWLKAHPNIRIKMTNTCVGEVQAKKTEPNIIITLWY